MSQQTLCSSPYIVKYELKKEINTSYTTGEGKEEEESGVEVNLLK